MATAFTDALERLITLAETTLEGVVITRRDEGEFRAVLKLVGQYQNHQIHLRKVLRADGSRKYGYYVMQANKLFAGFDNAPDSEALRLKYGDTYTQHRLETIPHFHFKHKQSIELTDEMTAASFFEWLKQNL